MTLGLDYKDMFQQSIAQRLGLSEDVAAPLGLEDEIPIRYYPVSLSWDGTWIGERSTTELSAGVTMHFRGMGTRDVGIEKNRFGADGSFFVFHSDLSHEYEFASGWQVYGRVHGQAADGPLVTSEQFGGGGGDTARGYFEAEALGDNGIFGTLELRTPSLLREKRISTVEGIAGEPTGNEWRFYVFGDAGTVTIHEALPEQDSSFRFASVGIGSEITLAKHLHGLVELALPLTSITQTQAHNARVNFRLWADF
jgi:hemolysin activation/secretion protein